MDTETFILKLFVLLLLTCSIVQCSLVCYQCDNLAHERDCNHIAKCGPHESCGVREFISSSRVYFNSGCIAKAICGAAGRKRSDYVYCTQCCDSNYCNKDLCDKSQIHVLENRCLLCNKVDHPNNCNTVTRCSPDDVCFADVDISLGERRYNLGCRPKTACPPNVGIVGRDLNKRITQCHQCCNLENCNRELCGSSPVGLLTPSLTQPPTTQRPTPQPTTAPPVRTLPPYCSTADHSECVFLSQAPYFCKDWVVVQKHSCYHNCNFCI